MADRAAAPDRAARTGRVRSGRVVLSGYALFLVAAGTRSAVELSLHPGRAPVAYGLSALAAAIYAAGLAAGIGVERTRSAPTSRTTGIARCCFVGELVGVVGTGTLSLAQPAVLAEPTVWSWFGAEYLFLPLVLPCAGLAWLRSCAGDRPTAA